MTPLRSELVLQRRVLHGAWLMMLAWSAAGCSIAPYSVWPYWPFEPPERTTLATPAKRISRLESIAENASRASLEERQRMAGELLNQIRTEQDAAVRTQIVRTMATLDCPAVQPALREGLRDPAVTVRVACCDALGHQAGPDAVEPLSRALSYETEIDVKLAAARALSRCRDPRAVGALGAALESSDPALQYRAMQSLKTLTGEDFGNDASAWRQYVQTGPTLAQPPPSLADRARRLF